MSKIVLGFLLVIILSGCASQPNPPTDVRFSQPFSHPELPNPVQPYKFDFYVVTEDNVEEFINQPKVFVAIEYQQTLDFRQFLEDMKRFMLEANGVICYYRVDLKEQFCENQQRYLNRGKDQQ